MADPMNRPEAIGWILRSLGGGALIIELQEEHVDDCIDDAVRWYVARKGVMRRAIVNIAAGIQEYAAPDDCDEVIKIDFPGVQLDVIAAVNPYAFLDVDQIPVASMSISGVPGGSFYGQLHQTLAHAETARRVIGSDPAWEYLKDSNIVTIYPRGHRGGVMMMTYLSTRMNLEDPVAPATVPINDFRRLRFRDRDIMLRYALAKAKWRLARIRGKYQDGMPGAGGSKNLDGDTLLGEAQGEVEALDEEIKALSDPVPFLIG